MGKYCGASLFKKNFQSLAGCTGEFKECPLLKKIQNADYNSLSDSGNWVFAKKGV